VKNNTYIIKIMPIIPVHQYMINLQNQKSTTHKKLSTDHHKTQTQCL